MGKCKIKKRNHPRFIPNVNWTVDTGALKWDGLDSTGNPGGGI